MFEALFMFVEQSAIQNIAGMVGIFTSTITPLLGAAVILYALYLAYQSLYEPQNLAIMESMKFIGSLAAVTTIALNTSWYMSNIVPAVLGSGDQIAQALLGSTGGGGASIQIMFDNMLIQINNMINLIDFKITSGESWKRGILALIQIFLLIIGCIPFLMVATAYLLVAKVMVSFLLIIGPLFIMMAFFPSTRSFFQAWTGQCFNYILLSLVYPIAFTTFRSILDHSVYSLNLSLATILMSAIVFFVLILISVQIPAFCSTLSGGIGINGLVGNIGTGIGLMKSGAKSTGRGAKASYRGAKKAGATLSNMGRGNIKAG